MSFIFTSTRDPRHHHSFPTRRSSDLSDRVLASWRLAAKVDPDTPAFEIPVEDRPTTAVLVRTRAQIPALENALRSRGLPVEVVGLGGLLDKIGRASCRERVESPVGAGSLKRNRS